MGATGNDIRVGPDPGQLIEFSPETRRSPQAPAAVTLVGVAEVPAEESARVFRQAPPIHEAQINTPKVGGIRNPNADNNAYVDWELQEKLLVRQDRELTAPDVVKENLSRCLMLITVSHVGRCREVFVGESQAFP